MPTNPDEFDLLTDALAAIRQARAAESDTRKRQDAVDEVLRQLRARLSKLPVGNDGVATTVALALERVFGGAVRRESDRLRKEKEAPPPWLTELIEHGADNGGRSARATKKEAAV